VFQVLEVAHVTEQPLEWMDATSCAVVVDITPRKRQYEKDVTANFTGVVT
jgi:hypothetical protein